MIICGLVCLYSQLLPSRVKFEYAVTSNVLNPGQFFFFLGGGGGIDTLLPSQQLFIDVGMGLLRLHQY